MALMEVRIGDGGRQLLVVTSDEDPRSLELAARGASKVPIQARESLEQALEEIGPVVEVFRRRLAAVCPDEVALEFGLLLGAETGLIVAKGQCRGSLYCHHHVEEDTFTSWEGDSLVRGARAEACRRSNSVHRPCAWAGWGFGGAWCPCGAQAGRYLCPRGQRRAGARPARTGGSREARLGGIRRISDPTKPCAHRALATSCCAFW